MPGTVTPSNIQVGRGDLWFGVTAPATPPVALAGGSPATGTYVGGTLGPAQFIYRPTMVDIETQQDTGNVGYAISKEELRMEFEIGELTYVNLKNFLVGALDQTTFISLGGVVIPPTLSILLISPRRSGGGAYIEAMLYNAVFSEDRTIAFAREARTAVRIIARAQSDLTRAAGDRQGFIHGNVISS